MALSLWICPTPAQAEPPPLFSINDIPPEQRPPYIEVNEIIQPIYELTPTPLPTFSKSEERKAVVSDKVHGRMDSGRNYSKEEVKALIISYSNEYDISSQTPLCIAQKESGFNHLAKNKSSSAAGTFQYLNSTWKSTDEGKAGHSVFEAEANVKAAIKYMASRRSTKPWVVANKCPLLN